MYNVGVQCVYKGIGLDAGGRGRGEGVERWVGAGGCQV